MIHKNSVLLAYDVEHFAIICTISIKYKQNNYFFIRYYNTIFKIWGTGMEKIMVIG